MYLLHLDLAFNQVAQLPNTIINLPYLSELDLSDNVIWELPEDFGRLQFSLKTLNVSGTVGKLLIRAYPWKFKRLKKILENLKIENNDRNIEILIFCWKSLKNRSYLKIGKSKVSLENRKIWYNFIGNVKFLHHIYKILKFEIF